MLCGPTASGKTALAVMLAKALDGEVISADSMQIYKGLTVGTAAPTEAEMQGVPHHLIGVIPPQQRFSVADWTAGGYRENCGYSPPRQNADYRRRHGALSFQPNERCAV